MKLFEIRKINAEKPKPSWANSDATVEIFKNQKMGMHEIAVRSSHPKHSKGFGGTWNINSQGVITVVIEKSFFDACVEKKAPWALDHLIKHEITEAKIAIRFAREKYPDKNPYVMAEKDENLGGKAHYEAIKELDNMSESTYDKNLSIEANYLGWKL